MAASAAKVLNQLQGQVGNGPEFEFEDPASMWIALVDACRAPDASARRSGVERCLIEARNSHWTKELWAEELATCAELTESYDGEEGMEPSEGGSDYVPG